MIDRRTKAAIAAAMLMVVAFTVVIATRTDARIELTKLPKPSQSEAPNKLNGETEQPIMNAPAQQHVASDDSGSRQESNVERVQLGREAHRQSTEDTLPSFAKSADWDAAVPGSEVGRYFEISPSVIERLPEPIPKDGSKGKNELIQYLITMAQEHRDKRWASTMEAKLQRQILGLEPNVFVIRNIECRTTICAVETESLSKGYTGIPYPDPLNADLWVGIGSLGIERLSDGSSLIVTLYLLKRRR